MNKSDSNFLKLATTSALILSLAASGCTPSSPKPDTAPAGVDSQRLGGRGESGGQGDNKGASFLGEVLSTIESTNLGKMIATTDFLRRNEAGEFQTSLAAQYWLVYLASDSGNLPDGTSPLERSYQALFSQPTEGAIQDLTEIAEIRSKLGASHFFEANPDAELKMLSYSSALEKEVQKAAWKVKSNALKDSLLAAVGTSVVFWMVPPSMVNSLGTKIRSAFTKVETSVPVATTDLKLLMLEKRAAKPGTIRQAEASIAKTEPTVQGVDQVDEIIKATRGKKGIDDAYFVGAVNRLARLVELIGGKTVVLGVQRGRAIHGIEGIEIVTPVRNGQYSTLEFAWRGIKYKKNLTNLDYTQSAVRNIEVATIEAGEDGGAVILRVKIAGKPDQYIAYVAKDGRRTETAKLAGLSKEGVSADVAAQNLNELAKSVLSSKKNSMVVVIANKETSTVSTALTKIESASFDQLRQTGRAPESSFSQRGTQGEIGFVFGFLPTAGYFHFVQDKNTVENLSEMDIAKMLEAKDSFQVEAAE